MELSRKFAQVDTSDFPDFDEYKNRLDMALWVLWIAKEKLGIRKLSAEQIASIITEVKEISTNTRSITYHLNKAGARIHTRKEAGEVYFEIMKPGKDHLISHAGEGSIKLFHFEPDKRFTSKRVLAKNVLDKLKGDLRIVDPYCGERTLDILKGIKNRTVKFLTQLDSLRDNERNRFLRELQDFKLENPNIEFRNYPHKDIHDRYMISSEFLVILGHSIKDLGAKESFAIILKKDTNKNIVEALVENFHRRWKQSSLL